MTHLLAPPSLSVHHLVPLSAALHAMTFSLCKYALYKPSFRW